MKTNIFLLSLIILSTIVISGCGVGYNQLAFITKSNFGLDIDTTPATTELSIARREALIAPSFEDGKTPPVLASFRSKSSFNSFLFGVSSTFSGGDAASAMSKHYRDDSIESLASENSSSLCLSKKPKAKIKIFGVTIAKPKFPEAGSVQPFIFGTDTTLGVKFLWSGVTPNVPETIKAGFNRKEFALAPVYGKESNCAGSDTLSNYEIKIPSFIATVDTTSDSADSVYHQYFATGIAATNLALKQDVRKAMIERLDPGIEEPSNKFGTDDNTVIINSWLNDTGKKQAIRDWRHNTLKSWMSKKKMQTDLATLLYTESYKKERGYAITDLNIK
jgi:hypothetical protein